jgi:hypothetical protein
MRRFLIPGALPGLNHFQMRTGIFFSSGLLFARPGAALSWTSNLWLAVLALGVAAAEPVATLPPAVPHLAMAREVTAAIHQQFWMPKEALYRGELGKDDPESIWGGGVLFSMLAAAARHEPQTYGAELLRFYDSLDRYWDNGVKIPGYEPCPTTGGGNDKYYDDNAWMVLTFAEAYQQTGDARMIQRAYDTLVFVLSGWDDTLGGGIWWHQQHKQDCKNTCANAPAAVGCLTLAKMRPDRRERMTDKALEIVTWTRKNLQAENGLFMDHINAKTKQINRVTLTYNSALMLRAELMLYQATHDAAHLKEAQRIGRAADELCHRGTTVYRDPPRWSHLMVEADLELHRQTGDTRALARAKATADSFYKSWREADGKMKLIDQASVARTLWLLVDSETTTGREFWKKMDGPGR